MRESRLERSMGSFLTLPLHMVDHVRLLLSTFVTDLHIVKFCLETVQLEIDTKGHSSNLKPLRL